MNTMRSNVRTHAAALALLLSATCAAPAPAQAPGVSDWGYYGGDAFGQRFSSLDQINRDNVTRLQLAWSYRTGELGNGLGARDHLTFEATPVLGFGLLYLSTGTDIVIALDPLTGRQRWRHDPQVNRARHYSELSSRGVSLWENGERGASGPCLRRVFIGTVDARLLALDADSGRPCTDFGSGGEIDLTSGLRVRDRDDYQVTSPPALFGNLVIVGSSIGDNRATDLERGVIRAFEARTGAQVWSFDPVPDSTAHPAAADWDPAQAARTGAGNAWGVMTVDVEHGLVFIPTGSASPDFFGGERLGDNRFANTLLVLDARSGRPVWQRQLVHHDLWDFDLAAQPVLGDVELQGTPVAAVIQATKTGMLYVFERTHGRPLFPIVERGVPASQVPGERAALTQPFSTLPALVQQQPVRAQDAWGLTFWDRGKCRALIGGLRNEGIFTPPDRRGTLLLPGYAGGVNWGGLAYDARRSRVIAAVNHLPMVVTLIPRQDFERAAHSGALPRSEFAPQLGTPYGMRREALLSPWGLPCTPPPWGTLASVDLRRQRIVWQVPLGSTQGIAPWFVPSRDFGMPNMGGPIATAGDLVFVAAAMDSRLRAYDIETGRELWKYALPAGGQATPMTYRAGPRQRQFLLISAGGHARLGTPQGDFLLAFALPEAALPLQSATPSPAAGHPSRPPRH